MKVNKTLYVNLFGASGAGKSSMSARLFDKINENGFTVEMVREYVKSKVWQGINPISLGQFYICANQFKEEYILDGKVDVVVTDSPWWFVKYYGEVYGGGWNHYLTKGYQELSKDRKELNFFINRTFKYNHAGRVGGEQTSDEDAIRMKKMMFDDQMKFTEVESTSTEKVLKTILKELKSDLKG